MNFSDILTSSLRTRGFKITKNRIAILDFLSNQEDPVSQDEIKTFVESSNPKVNKTTIYRELFFLLENGFVKEIEFGDGKKRYEIAINKPHHHHIICRNCRRVEDVPLDRELEHQEKIIEESTKFKLTDHMLEFFGLCLNCQ